MSIRINTEKNIVSVAAPATRQLAIPSRRLFLCGSAALTLAGSSAALFGAPSSAQEKEVRNVHDHAGQLDNFVAIRQHENDHVAFLVKALGTDARPTPTFQNLEQVNFAEFAVLAQTLENTGVGAYLGAAPSINSMEYLAAAGSIATIEARHAGYLNTYLGAPITANSADVDADPSFELPLTAAQVAAGAGVFIANLNGGPPVDYSTTPSDQNDIAILNFALALEYLEAAFYNINVPRFFKNA